MIQKWKCTRRAIEENKTNARGRGDGTEKKPWRETLTPTSHPSPVFPQQSFPFFRAPAIESNFFVHLFPCANSQLQKRNVQYFKISFKYFTITHQKWICDLLPICYSTNVNDFFTAIIVFQAELRSFLCSKLRIRIKTKILNHIGVPADSFRFQ